jgi:hydrogenase maturation protease
MTLVETLARTLLYEGYILYPYRASAVKNRQRFNFGGLYPPAYCESHAGADAYTMQTECLVLAQPGARVDVRVRCLHPLARDVAELAEPRELLVEGREPSFRTVESLKVDGLVYQTWQEVVEREVCVSDVTLDELLTTPRIVPFAFPVSHEREVLHGESGEIVGAVIRSQQAVEGTIAIMAVNVGGSLVRVRVTIANQTPLTDAATCERDAALLKSLISTHTILTVRDGEFVSLLEPPEELALAANECQNVGAWPVLVGDEGQRDTVLSSPIILYDYPQIAPESAGDLCDGTEIDEILLLRIMTLSDDEKIEARSVDARTRQILERAETISQYQLMNMHGAIRDRQPASEVTP